MNGQDTAPMYAAPGALVGPAGPFDALVELIAERVAQKLAPLVGAPAKPRYATRDNNPAGSEAAFGRACRTLSTVKLGRKPAILWTDFEAWLEAQRREPAPPKQTQEDADREELASAGVRLRPKKGARR